MALAVLNILGLMILFMVLLAHIANYEDTRTEENIKFKNSDKIVPVIYFGAIILFIKSIIVANIAKSEIIREDSILESGSTRIGMAAIMAPDLAGVSNLMFQLAEMAQLKTKAQTEVSVSEVSV